MAPGVHLRLARRVDVWGDKVYELEHMHLLRRSREAGLSLTVGEVALDRRWYRLGVTPPRILDQCPA
jgi:hypothetical protein